MDFLLSVVFPSLLADQDLVQGASAAVHSSQQLTIFDLIWGSGLVVRLVLLLLLIMSIITWGIVISKFSLFSKAKKQNKEFDDIFWASKNLAHIHEAGKKLVLSPVASVYEAGHRELTAVLESGSQTVDSSHIENIDRALKKAKAEEITRLEAGNIFLATTASAAPFIGLFGTVWGIMNAFIGLSQVKSSSIQAVAPGISEALIATAIGLAAAIPAAIFYNYFIQQVRVMSRMMDTFSAEFLNISRRHFLK
jgi:biopolymer transport protein TolQ